MSFSFQKSQQTEGADTPELRMKNQSYRVKFAERSKRGQHYLLVKYLDLSYYINDGYWKDNDLLKSIAMSILSSSTISVIKITDLSRPASDCMDSRIRTFAMLRQSEAEEREPTRVID